MTRQRSMLCWVLLLVVLGLSTPTQTAAQIIGTQPGPRGWRVGTVLPSTCAVGDLFFKSDATAGRNIYECATTNTWTQETGGGAVTGTANVLPRQNSTGTGLVDSGLTDNGNVLTVNRGQQGKVTSTSVNLAITSADFSVYVTTGATNKTITLPAATGLPGQFFHITKADAAGGGVILAPAGTDTINGVNAATAANVIPHGGFDVLWESNTGWVVMTVGFSEFTFPKTTVSAVAPGAGVCKIAWVAGTNAGSGKLIAFCGTSTTPSTIFDNVGSGF